MSTSNGIKSKKQLDLFEDADLDYEQIILDIEKYELARSGWIIWQYYLGLDSSSTVDETLERMMHLQKKAQDAKRILASTIKPNSNEA